MVIRVGRWCRMSTYAYEFYDYNSASLRISMTFFLQQHRTDIFLFSTRNPRYYDACLLISIFRHFGQKWMYPPRWYRRVWHLKTLHHQLNRVRLSTPTFLNFSEIYKQKIRLCQICCETHGGAGNVPK